MECYIEIKLDKPHYFPGEMLTAIVVLRSKKEIIGNWINLEVIGKEKAIYDSHTDPEARKDFRHTFIKLKEKAMVIPNGRLEPGEYELKVLIELPEGELPMSINHKNTLEEYSVDIAVRYSIKVEICTCE